MNAQHSFNGARLRKARTYRGFTIADLAEKIGCQRQTVSLYESGGIKMPDETIIDKLSQVLSFPKKYFFEVDNTIRTGSTYFRALLTTNKKYRSEQVQKMEFVSTICRMLMEYLDFPILNLPDFSCESTPEEKAATLRGHWRLNNRPVENLVFLAEENGIIVTSFDTSTDSIDAFSQMTDVDNEIIYSIGYSNNKTSASRIHFDIAHELGHICMHEWSEDVEMLSREEFKERENEANQFASAFLLPKEAFYADVSQSPLRIPYYIELKKKWKVSIQAMIRRAHTLGVITYEDYQMLMRTLQRRGMRKDEPLDNILITSKPTILKTAVQMLLDEGIFTPKEFMDELSFSYNLSLFPAEVEHLLGLDKGTLQVSNVIPFHSFSMKRNRNK